MLFARCRRGSTKKAIVACLSIMLLQAPAQYMATTATLAEAPVSISSENFSQQYTAVTKRI